MERTLYSSYIQNILIKTLTELKTPKAKSAAVRAIKILGAFEKRETLLSSNAIITVSAQLSSEDEDLLKQVTKCLAKFTSGANRCDQFMAMQIQGEEGHGFKRLVELTKSWNSNRTIWENALNQVQNIYRNIHLTLKYLVKQIDSNTTRTMGKKVSGRSQQRIWAKVSE